MTAVLPAQLFGAALVATSLVGCRLVGPSNSRFIIHVDSVSAPSVVSATDTVEARFYGHIGPDGCWRLAGIDRQLASASVDLTFRGEHEQRSGYNCTSLPVSLNHHEVLLPPLSTPFTITVHQPDGSLLHRQVTVQ